MIFLEEEGDLDTNMWGKPLWEEPHRHAMTEAEIVVM